MTRPRYCAPDPDDGVLPWCGDLVDGVVLKNAGFITCRGCIERLCERPQYYNQLRAQGLRTGDENDL